ncbi:hypothetical protein [Propionivibrio sp.]|uniref:hypothetical protein n=1 Tax=Propionivibrio sp. TaxID=2212460 RepID=UPI003BF0EE92
MKAWKFLATWLRCLWIGDLQALHLKSAVLIGFAGSMLAERLFMSLPAMIPAAMNLKTAVQTTATRRTQRKASAFQDFMAHPKGDS